MLDATTEELLSLTEAARLVPRRRGGKGAHVATLYRWAKDGLRGVVLQTLQVGGTRCTSREALQRFFERLTEEPAGAAHAEEPQEERVERSWSVMVCNLRSWSSMSSMLGIQESAGGASALHARRRDLRPAAMAREVLTRARTPGPVYQPRVLPSLSQWLFRLIRCSFRVRLGSDTGTMTSVMRFEHEQAGLQGAALGKALPW